MSTNNGAEGGSHLVDEGKIVDKAFLHFSDKLILQLVIVDWFMNSVREKKSYFSSKICSVIPFSFN